VWWYILVIPALRRLRQEGSEFKSSAGYTRRFCFKIKQKKERNNQIWLR
jgi:hypothetical protein